MRAVTFVDGAIRLADKPDPEPGKGEVLVRVRAAGLNGADMFQRAGAYPAPPGSPQDVPGLEIAGEVTALGPGAERFSMGEYVMGIVGGGGQAELCLVHERVLMPIPECLSWAEAGGTPETFTTPHDALFTQAHLLAGERVLVHGAAGGVGTAAVQIARVGGGRVTATVRNPHLREQVAALGARVIAPLGFAAAGPFDVILELVGATNLEQDLEAIESGGRISIIGLGAGSMTDIDLGQLLQKRGHLFGSTLRARPLEQKALAARGVERSVLPWIASGDISVPIAEAFDLAEAGAAYDLFGAGGKLGKIVLTVD